MHYAMISCFNNQLKSDQFGFEGVDLSKNRHYPLSDPLKYNEPKLTVESGVQCNRCPRTFKTFTNLKQHMARSHKVDSSKSKEERSSVIKNEKERQSSLHNIPAHLVTEDLQREIIVRYMRCLFFWDRNPYCSAAPGTRRDWWSSLTASAWTPSWCLTTSSSRRRRVPRGQEACAR